MEIDEEEIKEFLTKVFETIKKFIIKTFEAIKEFIKIIVIENAKIQARNEMEKQRLIRNIKEIAKMNIEITT